MHPKIHIELQGNPNSQTIFKKNKDGDSHLLVSKLTATLQ
jgi:hypothetical protein